MKRSYPSDSYDSDAMPRLWPLSIPWPPLPPSHVDEDGETLCCEDWDCEETCNTVWSMWTSHAYIGDFNTSSSEPKILRVCKLTVGFCSCCRTFELKAERNGHEHLIMLERFDSFFDPRVRENIAQDLEDHIYSYKCDSHNLPSLDDP